MKYDMLVFFFLLNPLYLSFSKKKKEKTPSEKGDKKFDQFIDSFFLKDELIVSSSVLKNKYNELRGKKKKLFYENKEDVLCFDDGVDGF